jgi:hypothetical protein
MQSSTQEEWKKNISINSYFPTDALKPPAGARDRIEVILLASANKETKMARAR